MVHTCCVIKFGVQNVYLALQTVQILTHVIISNVVSGAANRVLVARAVGITKGRIWKIIVRSSCDS